MKMLKRDFVSLAQYKNLRECFDKNLVKPILGKDYYNYGCDVYSCDEITTLDIQKEFYKLKHNLMLCIGVIILQLIIIILSLIMLIIGG